jgi:hypothetical protein
LIKFLAKLINDNSKKTAKSTGFLKIFVQFSGEDERIIELKPNLF